MSTIRRMLVASLCVLGLSAQVGVADVQYVLRALQVQSAGLEMNVGLNNLGRLTFL